MVIVCMRIPNASPPISPPAIPAATLETSREIPVLLA
jgi:hypothetical protein